MTLRAIDPTQPNIEPEPASDTCTDKGNARAFAFDHCDRFRYVADRGVWIQWTGTHWGDALPVDTMRAAKETVDLLLERAARCRHPNPDVKRALVKWALKSCSRSALAAMVDLAASEPGMSILSSAFDTAPHLFNVANGTIDLRTGRRQPHDRADLISKIANVEYAADAMAPRWDRFISEIYDGRADLITFVQRFAGYSLTGDTREQCFALCHGGGSNGKGRFLRALRRAAGDYARTADISTFIAGKQRSGAEPSPDLAALMGARFVTAGEAEQGVKLSEGLIKTVTGDDPVTCRRLREPPITYLPPWKLWLHVNHAPIIRGTDDGIWRRVKKIPFTVSFKGREDKTLDAKLDAELSGILAWAVRGAVDWYAHGLGEAADVTKATKEYRGESDALAPFLDAKLDLQPEGRIGRKEVLRLYTEWCGENGEEPWKPATLYLRLGERDGVSQSTLNGERGFKGIKERT